MTFWSILGLSAQKKFQHVHSTVNNKKEKAASKESKDGADSTLKVVNTLHDLLTQEIMTLDDNSSKLPLIFLMTRAKLYDLVYIL